MHPEKTKIVYCKESGRNEEYPITSFDSLGYTFRPRRSKSRNGKYFIGFSPGISSKAAKHIRRTSRQWRWSRRTDLELENLARLSNPLVRGWIIYYSRFYKSALRYPDIALSELQTCDLGDTEIQKIQRTPQEGIPVVERHSTARSWSFCSLGIALSEGWTIGAV